MDAQLSGVRTVSQEEDCVPGSIVFRWYDRAQADEVYSTWTVAQLQARLEADKQRDRAAAAGTARRGNHREPGAITGGLARARIRRDTHQRDSSRARFGSAAALRVDLRCLLTSGMARQRCVSTPPYERPARRQQGGDGQHGITGNRRTGDTIRGQPRGTLSLARMVRSDRSAGRTGMGSLGRAVSRQLRGG